MILQYRQDSSRFVVDQKFRQYIALLRLDLKDDQINFILHS